MSSQAEDIRQILTEIGNLKGGVGEIKGSLNGFITTQVQHAQEIKELRSRTTSLEKTEARLWGVASLVSLMISIVTPVALRLIFGG